MNTYRITRLNCGRIENHVYEAIDMNSLMQCYFWSDPGDIIKIELIGTTDEDMNHITVPQPGEPQH